LESIIKEANCGISVDFGNMDESYNRLLELLKKDDNKSLGENARKYVERNHDWRIITNSYIKEFEKIIK